MDFFSAELQPDGIEFRRAIKGFFFLSGESLMRRLKGNGGRKTKRFMCHTFDAAPTEASREKGNDNYV